MPSARNRRPEQETAWPTSLTRVLLPEMEEGQLLFSRGRTTESELTVAVWAYKSVVKLAGISLQTWCGKAWSHAALGTQHGNRVPSMSGKDAAPPWEEGLQAQPPRAGNEGP